MTDEDVLDVALPEGRAMPVRLALVRGQVHMVFRLAGPWERSSRDAYVYPSEVQAVCPLDAELRWRSR